MNTLTDTWPVMVSDASDCVKGGRTRQVIKPGQGIDNKAASRKTNEV